MDAAMKFDFIERFNNSIKLEYCFSVSLMIMRSLEDQDPEGVKQIKKTWESNIRERFEMNLNIIRENESIDASDEEFMKNFIEALLDEMKIKNTQQENDKQEPDMEAR